MLRPRLPWLLLLLALGSACGGEVANLPPIHRHSGLRPAEDQGVLTETVVWKRFPVLRERPDWGIRAGKSNVTGIARGAESASVLWLSGAVGEPPELEVRIPGAFDGAKFNELEVTVLLPTGTAEVSCSLVRRGERVVTSKRLAVAADRAPQELSLPVPACRAHTEPFDNIAITFHGDPGRMGLLAVNLRDLPMRKFLPSPDEPPELLRVEDEWRAAVGLSSRQPLETRLLVPQSSEVNLYFSVPTDLALPQREDSIRVSIFDDDGQQTALRVSLGPESEVRIEEGPRRLAPRNPRMGVKGRGQGGKQAGPARGKRKRVQRKPAAPKKGPLAPAEAFGEEVEQDTIHELPPLQVEPQVRLESPWTQVVLPLDDFAGDEATVRVEIVDWPYAETVCAVTPPVITRPTRDPATVLLVTVSSLRADHIGASGSDVEIDTALIDQLAARGVLFDDCFAPSNDEQLSLGAMMTGTWPPARPGDPAPDTLARRFRQAGFASWAVLGNADLNPTNSEVASGFDRVLAPTEGQRDAGETIDQLLGHLHELSGYPLFIWLHLSDPLGPYEPPDTFRYEYYPSSGDPYSAALPELQAFQQLAWDPPVRDTGWASALYKSEVTYVDRRLRKVFEHPRLRRGIIAVTGSHAENLESHGDWFSHTELYPDTLAVPMILYFPTAPAGRRVERPVSTADLGRTLLNLVGLRNLPFPGEHLLGLPALNPSAPRFAFAPEARDDAVAYRPPDNTQRVRRPDLRVAPPRISVSPANGTAALQSDRWFFLLHLADHGPNVPGLRKTAHTCELFDLTLDPGCERNVLAEQLEEAQLLHTALVDWLNRPASKAFGLPPPPEPDCPCTSCVELR